MKWIKILDSIKYLEQHLQNQGPEYYILSNTLPVDYNFDTDL